MVMQGSLAVSGEPGLLGWMQESRLRQARVIASSQNLGWKGVDLCEGENAGCDFEDVMIAGHYIGVQLNESAITVATRRGDDWQEVYNPPKSLWIHPEGTPFSLRHKAHSRWAGIVIRRDILDSACGQPLSLRAAYMADDGLLHHLLCALVSHISSDDPNIVHNSLLTQSLLRSFMLALGARYGSPLPACGGITPFQMKTLNEWLKTAISGSLSVKRMAEVLHLSEAHFAREFKRTTGRTPWDYVVQLRIDLACSLLADGECASDVAFRCGFADQSHLSRVLKARRGITPRQLRLGFDNKLPT